MLIRNIEIGGDVLDIRCSHGQIIDIGKTLTGTADFDGQGGALIPGLHDHHIHLNATAAALNSVKCGPPDVNNGAELIAALNNHEGSEFLRGVAYHHSVAGKIDRVWLDENGPKRPIRIQHRSGRLWILNSLAMDALGVIEPADGRLLDKDAHIRSGSDFPDLSALVGKLLAWGVTGATEVTPSNGLDEFNHYMENARPLRLSIMGRAELSTLDSPIVGPLKLHYHDHNLPALDDLAAEIKAAHEAGRNIASHCVTRAELMLTLAAIEQAGPIYGDRIEHAAIADDVAIDWMKALGVIAVTQPNFIAERVEAYLKDVPKDDHENLWRLKTFDKAGLRVAAGSDAPFGDPNPWAAMAAAVNRPEGFEQEAISPERALAIYTKPANDAGAPSRKIEIGQPADFCLLNKPWSEARRHLEEVKVQATWIDGQLVYDVINQSPS